MQVSDIMSAPIVGNVIGVVSLIVGIIGLIWTIITYRMTRKIEKKLPDAQVRAINKKIFNEYRSTAIKALTFRQNAAVDAGTISQSGCDEVIAICNRIIGYKRELRNEDYESVESLYEKLRSLMQDKNQMRDNSGLIIFLEVTAGLISILEKGEYDI